MKIKHRLPDTVTQWISMMASCIYLADIRSAIKNIFIRMNYIYSISVRPFIPNFPIFGSIFNKKIPLETRLWAKGESTDSPPERMHHSSVVCNSSIWVFGGRAPDLAGLSDLYRYDICTYLFFQSPFSQNFYFSWNIFIKKNSCESITHWSRDYFFSEKNMEASGVPRNSSFSTVGSLDDSQSR